MDDSFDVVISGIGGHFPECDDVDELMQKLHLGENLITCDDRRWEAGKLGVDAHTGKVNNFEYFDNQFFGIHRPLTIVTDPITRLLLERVQEAVVDAGYHPRELYGSRTSVYTSCSISENEATFLFSKNRALAFTIMGTNRSMMANRVSYFFNFNGRSCAYDGTWCWAAIGLQMAYSAIKAGECDSVLMGGTSLCLHPEMSVMYSDMNYLTPDGVCRPFDADANGYARAESQVVFLVQRSDLAKRAYAKVLGAKMLFDSALRRDLLSPTVGGVYRLITDLYKDMNVDKNKVDYVECYGSGYQPTDYAEVEGLRKALCADRDKPLLIGSIKGNVGHSEGPSGMVSLVKVISILQSGLIPKTLHFTKPNPRIPSLVDGKIQVVAEITPISIQDDTVIGSTSVSYAGNVGHVVLGVGSKNKVAADPDKELPRLILACGRTDDGLKRILEKISSVPFDPEYYRLVQDIFSAPVRSYEFRGHVVCPSPPDTPISLQLSGRQNRPVWFVFSGMGSQWPGMGRDLLRIPAFAATIDRCHAVLEKKGLDLLQILTHPEPDVFDNILHSFVGIAAVQVGLINILRLLEIEADGFIGHSVGEQACAYMDGCIDEEQTMLAAYARGMASNEANLIRGMMAAVGMGYHQIKDELPESIEVACHNSRDNCTISGPADDVNAYVEQLKERNVFARAVNVSNTAYHSRYVKDAGPILMRRLSEVITEPKQRSPRWISTSAPKDTWDTDEARFCSAQYLTNNLLGSVLFEEAMAAVPNDAVLIEIAPHGLLQAILRRSSPRGSINIPLTKRDTPDGLAFLYAAIAKMYVEGLCPKVANLYPDVEFPVSRQTPSTANLCTWRHDEKFYTTTDSVLEKEDYLNTVCVNIECPTDILRGFLVCQPSYYLRTLWSILSNKRRFGTNEMPIEYDAVRFFDPCIIPSTGEKYLNLTIQKGAGIFELVDDNAMIITGRVRTAIQEDQEKEEPDDIPTPDLTAVSQKGGVKMDAEQLYSELASRGHTYKENLMTITSVDISDDVWVAEIRHNGDMGIVLEACFQLFQLHNAQESQVCTYPKSLNRLKFYPKKFFDAFPEVAEIVFSTKLRRIVCTGLLLIGVEFRPLQLEAAKELKLQASSLNFIPYETKSIKSPEDLASIALQLAVEIQPNSELGVSILELNNGSGRPLLELSNEGSHKTVGGVLRHLASEHHNIELNILKVEVCGSELPKSLPVGAKACGIILAGPSTAEAAVAFLERCPSAMILTHVKSQDKKVLAQFKHLKVLAECSGEGGQSLLLGKVSPPSSRTEVIMVPPDAPMPKSVNVSTGAVFVWTEMPPMGIPKVVDEVTKLPRGGVVRMVFLLDSDAPKFSTSLPLYRDQLALGMRVNVLRGGQWGSFKALPLPKDAHATPNGKGPLLIAVSTDMVGEASISHWGLEQLSATEMGTEIGLDYSGSSPSGKVFGIAKAINGLPQLDPLLKWPVPEGWTSAEAATVPIAYCQALLALRLRTKIHTNDNIVVTTALRPEGQAAVRVALATPESANVFAIVRDEKELSIMKRLFKDAVGVEKLHLVATDVDNLSTVVTGKLGFAIPIHTIVTSRPQDVRTDTLAILSKYGQMINLGGAHTPLKQSFGMFPFVNSLSLTFVSIQSVLHMREDDRQSVFADIAEGTKRGGFIRPLRHVVRSNSSAIADLWDDIETIGNKVVLSVEPQNSPGFLFRSGSSCLIAGANTRQIVHLANWSAKRGIKEIIAVHSETQSRFLLRHARLLNTVYGVTLHIVKDVTTGFGRALQCGVLAIMFAAAYDQTGRTMAEKMTRIPVAVPLVILAEKGSDHGVLADACSSRHRGGGKTLLLVGQMEQATSTRILDWLLRTENPSMVTLLRSPADSRTQRIPAVRLLKLLPQGAESLAALGRSLRPSSEPDFIHMTTNGPRLTNAREVFPVFVVPGIAAPVDVVLRPLAEKLLVPLICIRLPQQMGRVLDLAHKIAKLIQKLQPSGPYSLLGFDWTSCLTQQIAVELRKSDNHVTMYLVDGEVRDVQQVAALSRRPDFDSLLLSASLNLQANSSAYAEICALSSWTERLQHLRSMIGEESTRCEVESALNAIREWVYSLAQHEVTPCEIDTHLIQSSATHHVAYTKTSTLKILRCTESYNELTSTATVQHYINDNMVSPNLQSVDTRINRAKEA